MDIRKYFGKRTSSEQGTTDEEHQSDHDVGQTLGFECEPPQKKQHVPVASAKDKKKQYKANLSYKSDWEKQYPWVQCKDPKIGMFFTICIKWGKPPPSAKGGWTTRGIMDWNHVTKLLKQYATSKWHRDALMTEIMAQPAESGNVIDLQTSRAAKDLKEEKSRNREIILKLLRSVYFLVKNRIPHSTTYKGLVELQVENGDKLLYRAAHKGRSR